MMVKSLRKEWWLICLCVLLFGCKLFSSSSTPQATTIAFYKSLGEGEITEATEMISDRFKTPENTERLRSAMYAVMEVMQKNSGLERVEISNEVTTGPQCTLTVSLFYKNQIRHTSDQHLVKEDGVWKIDARRIGLI